MRKCIFCKRRYKKGGEISFHKFPSDLTERNMWLKNMRASNWTPKKEDSLCSKHFDVECFNKHYNRVALKFGSVPTIFEGLFEEPKSCEKLVVTDSENVSESERIKVNVNPQLAVFTYPHKKAMSNITSESMSKSSSFRHESPKQREVKRFPSKRILKDNIFQKDANSIVVLKRDLQNITKTNHNHEASQTKKKSRIQYGIAHDHQYENTKQALQRAKLSAKVSKARVKALTRRVKSLKIKVASLKTVIKELNKRNKVSEDCVELLTYNQQRGYFLTA